MVSAAAARNGTLSSNLLSEASTCSRPGAPRSRAGSDSGSDSGSDGPFSAEDFQSTLDLPALYALGQTADEAASTPHDRWVAVKLAASAFCLYFGVLLIKLTPFAATYPGERLFGLPLKAVLALAQTLGYLTGKPLALMVVPKLKRGRLLAAMLFVLWGEGGTLALAPRFGGVATTCALFVGGLFGASAWGLIVRFCEGRARTDAIIACVSLCMMSMSGVAKGIGSMLMVVGGLGSGAMMSSCALCGTLVGTACALALAAQEAPSVADVALRGERRELSSLHEQGARLLRRHGAGIALTTLAYVIVGTLRAFRDFYQVELFEAVGLGGRPGLLAASELIVAACILLFTGALSLLSDSWLALNVIVCAAASGGLLVALSTAAFHAGLYARGFAWIVLVGAGLFLSYIPIGTVLYERLLAAAHEQLTSSLLSILSDASVLVGTSLLLLCDSYAAAHAGAAPHGAHAGVLVRRGTAADGLEVEGVRDFFSRAATAGGVAVLLLMCAAGIAFNRSVRRTRLRASLHGLPVLLADDACPPPSDSPVHVADDAAADGAVHFGARAAEAEAEAGSHGPHGRAAGAAAVHAVHLVDRATRRPRQSWPGS